MIGARIVGGILVVWLIFATPAIGQKLAVFPVEDLSMGLNGVNFDLTRILAERLSNKGLEIVPEEEILAFMVKNRIRRLGSLGTPNIIRFGKDLEADFVLLGTLCQYEEDPAPTAGLTLFLIRTGDAEIIWSGAGGGSSLDDQHVLGLTAPKSAAKLLQRVAANVLDDWPDNLDTEISAPPGFLLETVRIARRYIRPGEKMHCTVRLRPLKLWGELPQVFLRIDDINVETSERDGTGLFEVDWLAPKQDGVYRLALIQYWRAGIVKRVDLGNYQVDSEPPRVSMDIKGVRVNGNITFSDKVVIVPQLLNREPTKRWRISIETQDGEVLASEERKGGLPPQFVWKGMRNNGQQVEEGNYVIMLRVWDRALNVGIDMQPLSIVRTDPDLDLIFEEGPEELTVTLVYGGEIPAAFWEVEIRSEEGELILLEEGEEMPVTIGVPLDKVVELEEKERISIVVTIKDILGNKTSREVDDLLAVTRKDEFDGDAGEADASEWVVEF